MLSLKEVFAETNKKYGASSIAFAGDLDSTGIEVWPTNSYGLDYILGNGGLPKGRIIEVYGEPSMGKTSAALYLIAQIQKQGGMCAFVDVEFSFNADHAEKIGVDVSKLIFAQPSSGEEAFELIEKLVHTGEVALVVVDSTAALVPMKELEGDISDSNVALQARMMSKGLRMITGAAAKSKTTVMFISQTRSKIGFMQTGPQHESTAGQALKFYASCRIEVKRVKTLKEGEETVGNRLKIIAVKNKVAWPFRTAEVDLLFASGFDTRGETLEKAEELGIITKTGNTYSFDGVKLGVGREKAIEYLTLNPEKYAQLRKEIADPKGSTEESRPKSPENEGRESTKSQRGEKPQKDRTDTSG